MSIGTLVNQTAVVGIGVEQFKRGQSPLPERGLLVRAIIHACEDAGINPSDIDGFATYGDDHNEPVRLMSDLGIRELCWSSQVFGGGGGGIAGAFGQAAAAILTGQAKVVVVYRALVEGSSGRLSAAVMSHHLNAHMVAAGLIAPAQVCALRAQRLFEFHGVPKSAARAFIRACYYHGERNPGAIAYGKTFSDEEYDTARWIAEPFRLLDCSRENDGAGALILVASDVAKHLNKPPIYLQAVAEGCGQGWGDLLENDAVDLYPTAGFSAVAKNLWQRATIGPGDIDVAQIYENFSAQGVASIIDHGFCDYESVAEFMQFENLIAPGGKLPINTAGGNTAQGFIHGIGIAIEAVKQLRGESSNPVPDAKTCLLAGGPGAPVVSSAIFSNTLFD